MHVSQPAGKRFVSITLMKKLLHITTSYHHWLKNMLQSGQRQLQLDLHVPGTTNTSMVPNMFDAS